MHVFAFADQKTSLGRRTTISRKTSLMIIVTVQARRLLKQSSNGGGEGKKGIKNYFGSKIILVINGISY